MPQIPLSRHWGIRPDHLPQASEHLVIGQFYFPSSVLTLDLSGVICPLFGQMDNQLGVTKVLLP